MPAETSIPCSKQARDLVKEAKGDLSYSEFLQEHFDDSTANPA